LVFDFVLCQIDVEDSFSAAQDAGQQLPERHDDVEQAQRRADGFSEQQHKYGPFVPIRAAIETLKRDAKPAAPHQ